MISNQEYYFAFTTICTMPVVFYIVISIIQLYNCVMKKSIGYSLRQAFHNQAHNEDPIQFNQINETLDEDPTN